MPSSFLLPRHRESVSRHPRVFIPEFLDPKPFPLFFPGQSCAFRRLFQSWPPVSVIEPPHTGLVNVHVSPCFPPKNGCFASSGSQISLKGSQTLCPLFLGWPPLSHFVLWATSCLLMSRSLLASAFSIFRFALFYERPLPGVLMFKPQPRLPPVFFGGNRPISKLWAVPCVNPPASFSGVFFVFPDFSRRGFLSHLHRFLRRWSVQRAEHRWFFSSSAGVRPPEHYSSFTD